jgi:hypothetical protein
MSACCCKLSRYGRLDVWFGGRRLNNYKGSDANNTPSTSARIPQMKMAWFATRRWGTAGGCLPAALTICFLPTCATGLRSARFLMFRSSSVCSCSNPCSGLKSVSFLQSSSKSHCSAWQSVRVPMLSQRFRCSCRLVRCGSRGSSSSSSRQKEAGLRKCCLCFCRSRHVLHALLLLSSRKLIVQVGAGGVSTCRTAWWSGRQQQQPYLSKLLSVMHHPGAVQWPRQRQQGQRDAAFLIHVQPPLTHQA